MQNKTLFLLSIFLLSIGTLSAQVSFQIGEIHYSPDGNYIVGVGSRAMMIWDAETGELLFSDNLDIYYDDMAWSPDSFYIVTASGDLSVRVWNVADPDYSIGTLIHEVDTFSERMNTFLTVVEWSPDGDYIAIGSEFQASIQIWDADSLDYLYSLTGGGNAGDMVWHPSDNLLGLVWSYSEYDAPYVIPTTEDAVMRPYLLCSDCPQHNATAIAWNREGDHIAVGYDDGTIQIVDVESNNSLLDFQSGSFVASLSWSVDNMLIVTPYAIHDAQTGNVVEHIRHSTFSVDFHPTRYEIAYFDNNSLNLVIEDVSYLEQSSP